MSTAHRSEPDTRVHAGPLPDSTVFADSNLGADSGMPGDRQARIAARRAFVEMKQVFMRSVAQLVDRKGQWLREQVRLANDPLDLWLLRGAVIEALRDNDVATRTLRAELYRSLDNLFPEAFLNTPPATPSLPAPWKIWANGAAMSVLRR